MSDIKQTEDIFLKLIAATKNINDLESIRIRALGKKGEVTKLMKTISLMEEEERRTKAPLLNALKDKIIENIEKKKLSINTDFLNEKNPDIICLQEYQNSEFKIHNYPYVYEKLRGDNLKYGQAIFSKYPIINKGSVDFNSSSNNAIFSDIKIMNDTIRVYNIHLQSFSFEKVNPLININKKNEMVIKNISDTFIQQEQQVNELKKSIKNSPYKVIVTGDLNNTAFSYVYKELSKSLNDAFKAKGNGLGITYNYNFIPLRIDFVFTEELFKINSFKTFKLNLSDHEPIYTELKF